ncbi:MAG TPA: outer membrane beta-barrel protein [Vicinamibacterales bacterium]|nr:outer membrane beta-barrel protein [Vicinamibacterales bacterium]
MGVSRGARAQSAVGAGPLTTALSDIEPQTGVLASGPVRFAPGVTIKELGYDTNVFDESAEEGPNEDWVAAVTPDVSLFTRLRLLRISAYAGSDLTYYQTYESERSVGYAGRARFDFLFSRMRPFVGLGRAHTRERANGEIDTRADRTEQELSGGLAFDISPHSLVYGSWAFSRTEFENAFEDGVDLGESLNRERDEYQAGFKTDLTPLLSVQVFGSRQEDVFLFDPLRNATSTGAVATFRIASEAVVTGVASVGYRDMQPVDPVTKPFRGLTGSAAITYPLLEIGRFIFQASRGTEYSFDAADAYFVANTAQISYTNRLFSEVDAQVRVGRSLFDYDARLDTPARTETVDTAAGSLGYNLRNRTRIAVNYEIARRRSPEKPARNYDRRRIYLSWLFAF